MLVSHSYWPESTPPQRRWMAFVKVFRQQGWDVDVVAPGPVMEDVPDIYGLDDTPRAFTTETGPHGESIRRVPNLVFSHSRAGRLARHCLAAIFSVPRALVTPRPDLVIVTIPSLPHIVSGWLIARLRRRPLVVEMRDAWPDLAYDSKVANPRVTALLKVIMTRVQKNANLVVTVTDGFRRQLQSRGINTAVTVHNGISTERLPSVPVRHEHGGPLRVLYMGNHGESQGLEVVVKAAALAGRQVDVRFVGSGTVKARLAGLAQSVGAEIDFWTVVHGENIAQHYEWADTCVVSLRGDWPSFKWTVPSKIYELLSTGRHITAVLQGEAARIIESSGSGHVVRSDPQAVATLWTELALHRDRLSMNVNGRRWVARHANTTVLAEEYILYLRHIVNTDHSLRVLGD